MSEPTLSEIIRLGVQRELANLHTAMPGQVESYDSSTRMAKVKPLLRRMYDGEDRAVDLPVISNVPVIHPRTASAQVSLPVSAGDCVLLIFCERSIDRWLELGGTVDPQDPAMHALNEAVAIPGLFPKGQPLALNGERGSLEIGNGSSHIEIARDGKITVSAPQVNLGDESGATLLRTTDVASIIAPSGGGPCSLLPGAGTTKTRAS